MPEKPPKLVVSRLKEPHPPEPTAPPVEPAPPTTPPIPKPPQDPAHELYPYHDIRTTPMTYFKVMRVGLCFSLLSNFATLGNALSQGDAWYLITYYGLCFLLNVVAVHGFLKMQWRGVKAFFLILVLLVSIYAISFLLSLLFGADLESLVSNFVFTLIYFVYLLITRKYFKNRRPLFSPYP